MKKLKIHEKLYWPFELELEKEAACKFFLLKIKKSLLARTAHAQGSYNNKDFREKKWRLIRPNPE